MSYTPEHHKLGEPIQELVSALEKVEKILEDRIEEQSWGNWSDEHVKECEEFSNELTALQRKIKRKWMNV